MISTTSATIRMIAVLFEPLGVRGARGVLPLAVGLVEITAGSLPAPSCGKIVDAFFQSPQPSRQTSESAVTRPSPIHLRIVSPGAGPNCPPEGGRTYQTAFGASAMGSCGIGGCAPGGAAGGMGAMA